MYLSMEVVFAESTVLKKVGYIILIAIRIF